MTDLRDRITAHVDQVVPPVDVDELVAALSAERGIRRLDDGPVWSRPWWQWRWVAIAAGAAVVLTLIGAAALLGGNAEDPPVITQVTTTTPPTTLPPEQDLTTTTPPTTVPPEPETAGWVRRDVDGNDLRMVGVVQGGPGLIAAGHTFTRSDVWGRTQVWSSPDGEEWTPVGADTDPTFEEGSFASGLLASGDGYVMFGVDRGGTALWTSRDGLDWTHQMPIPGEPAMEGLVLRDGSYLLYGAGSNCNWETELCHPANVPRILTSSDGLAWDEHTTPVTFTAITQMADGSLLAAARRGMQPTTWLSSDGGGTWALHGDDFTVEPGTPAGEVWHMAATPAGILAAGLDADQEPVLWQSPDGRSFEIVHRLADARPAIGEAATVEAILATGDGVLAAGAVEGEPAIWTSEDGLDWRAAGLAGTFLSGGELFSAVTIESRLIVVGHHRFDIGGEALVLSWDPAG